MSLVRIFPAVALVATLCFPLAGVAQTLPATGTAAPQPPAGATPAQPALSPRGHRHHEPFIRALRRLNLTPDQRRQVAAIRADERLADRDADAPTRKANALKMRERVRAILTPDQQAQLGALLHRPRNHNVDAGPQPNPAPTPGR